MHNKEFTIIYCTGIAETLQCKIYVTAEKRSVLMCLEDARLSDMLAKSPETAKVHIVPMGKLRYPVGAIVLII